MRGSRPGARDPTTPLAILNSVSAHQLDGEIVAEEDAAAEDAVDPVRRLPGPAPEASLPALRPEVKSAAIAAAGGVLAGAATVAAVRAVSAVGSRASAQRRLTRRRRPAGKVIASRSFLVDVHLLDR
jgi:hypothetical protein